MSCLLVGYYASREGAISVAFVRPSGRPSVAYIANNLAATLLMLHALMILSVFAAYQVNM